MPHQLEKHGHVLLERNPDGTYNVYTVALAQQGLSESACAAIKTSFGGVPGMPASVVAPMAPLTPMAPGMAPTGVIAASGMTPAGAQLAGIIAAVGQALGVAAPQQAVVPEGFEEDATKRSKSRKPIKSKKGMLLYGGNLDIHASDPRIFLILFPKKSKKVPRGFALAKAKIDANKVFKKVSRVTENSGYAPQINTLLKNASNGSEEFWAFRPPERTVSKFAAAKDSGPDIGADAWTVKVGNRGVTLVLANPKNTRAQKLLTPADELASYLGQAIPEEAFVARIDR